MALIQTYPIIAPLSSAYVRECVYSSANWQVIYHSTGEFIAWFNRTRTSSHKNNRKKKGKSGRKGGPWKVAHQVIDSVIGTRTGRNLVRSLCEGKLRASSSYITKVARWPFLKVYNFITDIPGAPWKEFPDAKVWQLLALSARISTFSSCWLPSATNSAPLHFSLGLAAPSVLSTYAWPLFFRSRFCREIHAPAKTRSYTRKRSWFPVAVENCKCVHVRIYRRILSVNWTSKVPARSLRVCDQLIPTRKKEIRADV